jgi:peptide/nickel transport system substrate-binding protein
VSELDTSTGAATPEEAPAEIRSFLIADVRGYTLFTQERGDEAAAKLAAKFAQVAREQVEARGGQVLELRGDEALCVFTSPRQAIRAAVDLQDRFVEETVADPSVPLAVGIGLDAGEAVPVEGGYRGGALNLAARLCGQAGPGEILATREIVHLARKVEGVAYAERGELTLKGLADPVRVIAVASEERPAAVRLAPVLPVREPPGPDKPERRGRRRVLVAGLVVLIVAAAVAVPLVLFGGGAEGLASVPANSLGIIDPESGIITGSIPLPNAPGAIAEGEGGVWVTAPDDGRVIRVDPETEAVVDTTQVGGAPAGIAVGLGAVWVVDTSGPSLVRISPDTNEVVDTFPVGNGPAGVAVGSGAVWVANRVDGTVSRIDPSAGEVVMVIPTGSGPTGITADQSSVWVANGDEGTVVRIDPDTNTIDTSLHVGNQPGPIAIGPDGVWVANTLDGTVSRIDPASGTVAQTTPVGPGPSAVASTGDSAWVPSEYGATVTEVRASGSASVISTGTVPRGATAVGDAIWVSVRGAVTSHRGGTLRIVQSEFESFDPATSGEWSILTLTNDGLVGYKRVGGQDGLTLVPDLAVALPTPTDGGTTYRFQLRDDLRYSTGDPVRASDFRHALERGFHLAENGYVTLLPLTIKGTEVCRETPESCDLSEGVETDDAAGTVTFHLTEPDSTLLYKLALPFAYAVPESVPFSLADSTPVPATGPYMIDEYVPGQLLTLVRNPVFEMWSVSAQPDGYPDRIELTLGVDVEDQATAVEAGTADSMGPPFGLSDETTESLLTEYAGRVHTFPLRGTFSLALNTSIAPFESAEARRAVRFAIDRGRVSEFAPLHPARITCQFLAPNVQGYEPYCPFTLDPNPAGQWSSPDMDQARDLVAASGTTGDPVHLVFAEVVSQGLVDYLVGLFQDLGYEVTSERVPLEENLGMVLGPSDRIAVGILGWLSDYPAASGFFEGGPLCDAPYNPFGGAYCNPQLDATVEQAQTAELTDSHQANELWAAADRMLVDDGPLVPYLNLGSLDFVSERVGNYQHHPQWGILLSQLWVR